MCVPRVSNRMRIIQTKCFLLILDHQMDLWWGVLGPWCCAKASLKDTQPRAARERGGRLRARGREWFWHERRNIKASKSSLHIWGEDKNRETPTAFPSRRKRRKCWRLHTFPPQFPLSNKSTEREAGYGKVHFKCNKWLAGFPVCNRGARIHRAITHTHLRGICDMPYRDPPLLDKSTRGGYSFLSSLPPALDSRGRRVIDAYLTCLVYIFIRRWRRWILLDVPFALTRFSLRLSLPLRLFPSSPLLSIPSRVHTQASPAGGEGDRPQWLLRSNFCQSLHVSILHQHAATQWTSHEWWCRSAAHTCKLCYVWKWMCCFSPGLSRVCYSWEALFCLSVDVFLMLQFLSLYFGFRKMSATWVFFFFLKQPNFSISKWHRGNKVRMTGQNIKILFEKTTISLLLFSLFREFINFIKS